MAQTPFKARLGLETPTGQDVNSGGDIKINGVSINTGGTLDNVFYLDTQDMDDVADGATYVKTENNLTDSLKTNYDSAYTHSTTTTGNPHSVTKSDVGLGNVVDTDTTNADNISDGTINAIITLTQETNFETAYSKSHDQNTDTGTSSDDFSIGDGTDTNKTISIDNGDANSPQLKYNASTNTWQYSNDGTIFNDIGTLPSNLAYTDQENTFTETQIIPAIKPSADSTTSFQITKADGITPILNVDSTNSRIGIGTITPTDKFEVSGASGSFGIHPSGVRLNFSRAGTSYFDATQAGGNFSFIVNGNADTNPSLFLSSNNNVGIGTTNPSQKLHVAGTTGSVNQYISTGDSGNTGLYFANTYATTPNCAGIQFSGADDKLRIFNAQTATNHLAIDNTGKVTIGTTYTAPTLDNEVATKKYVDDNSGGGSAENLYLEVNQTTHGFDGDFIYHNGTVWVKAQADDPATCATHFAVEVDTDNFIAYSIGDVDLAGVLDDSGSALVAGNYYFLSQTVAGKVTGTNYTSGISQSVLKVNATNEGTVLIEEPYNITETVTEFSDDLFKIYNNSDSTKEAKFNLSNISTLTQRSYSLQDNNGTLAMLEIEQVFNENIVTKKAVIVGNNIIDVTASKTLALTDNGYLQKVTSATNINITVPPNSSVAFPIGTEIPVVQYNTGEVTFVQGSGVTINSADGDKTIGSQYATVTLKKMATDEWLLIGNLKA